MSSSVQQVNHRNDGIDVVRLQPNIGAEIYGIDLSGPHTPQLRDTLLELLLEHEVIFFRDQSLDSEQQQSLARLFGELGTDSTDGVRTVQHYGVPDYGSQARHLERVVVKGDRPVR